MASRINQIVKYRKGNYENKYLLWLAFSIPLVFFLFAFILPVFSILGLGFAKIPEILSDSYYIRVLFFTYGQALLSALFAVLASLPAAYFLYRYNIKGGSAIRAFATIPFIVPPIIAVLGFVHFFGNAGYLNKFLMQVFNLENPPLKILYSFKAIIIVHVFYNLPVSLKIILDRLEKIPMELYQTSLTLGSNKIKSFFKIVLPFLLPSLISAFSIIFLYCFLSFAVIYVLSGGPRFSVIEIEVFNFIKNNLDYSSAAGLSLCGMFLCFSTVGLLFFLQKKLDFKFQKTRSLDKLSLSHLLKKPFLLIFMLIYLVFYLLLSLAPILSVLFGAFLDKNGKFTFAWIGQIFSTNLLNSLSSSIVLALSVAILTSIFSLFFCYYSFRKGNFNSRLNILFMTPLFVSPFLIAGGYLLLGGSLDFSNPFFLLILAHAVVAYPISSKFIQNGLSSYNKNLSLASYSLGQKPFSTFLKIELPYILPSLFSQMVFAFAVSTGELSAALIFASNKNSTVPIQISRLLSAYRIELACALGSVLIVISFIVFLIIELLGKRQSKTGGW